MKIRAKGVIGLAAIVALSLTACSSGGGDTPEESPDSSTSADPSDSAEPTAGADPITMTFQSLSDQPGAIAAVSEIVDGWNADNPDAQVEIVPAGWDGVYDKLVTQFTGGAAPDIIHYETASIIPFAEDGYIADLAPYLSDDVKNDISQGVWDSVTVNDEIIAVPTQLQTYIVFANKGILEEAGIEIPTGDTMSWDQLREMAKATTDADTYGLGWGLKSPTAAFMSFGLGFGGTYFEGTGPDAEIKIGEGELAVPKRVGEMAFDDKSVDPISLTQSGGEVLASFYAGNIAMTIQGSFQGANMVKDAPADLDWIALPALEGSMSAAQAANPQTVSVNIDSEHVEQAAAFVNYFAGADNMAQLNLADALIPASESAREMIATETKGEDGWTEILASADELTAAPFLFASSYSSWKDTVATPSFQKFLAQQIDLDGLGKELESGWAQVNR